MLGWWNTGRLLGASRERQYKRMNIFLNQIVTTVAECQGLLGCNGDEGCVIEAVEAQQQEITREIRRAAQATSPARVVPPPPLWAESKTERKLSSELSGRRRRRWWHLWGRPRG